MMKKEYYRVSWLEEHEGGVAYAPDVTDHNFLPENGYYNGFIDFDMQLKEGGFSDYLSNNLGLSLCSEKLKNILSKYLKEAQPVQWLEVNIIENEPSIAKRYYFIHFPEKFDVLDNAKTIFARGSNFVVKAVINSSKANGLHVFEYVGNYNGIIVDSLVKEEIEKQQCTGIDFLKFPVT